MESLAQDLRDDIAESEHGESTAQKEYADLLADSKATREQDVKSLTQKENSKSKLQSKVEELKTKRVLTLDELKQVNAYVADLHTSCDFIMQNFDLRKEARSNEVESLKNAKAVL